MEPIGGAERRTNLGRAKYVNVNWHFFLLSFSAPPTSLPLSSSAPPPLSFSLSVPWPSGQSICLSSLSDLSFTMTRAIQKLTTHTHTQCQAAGAAVCKHSSISHISSLQQDQPSKTPQQHVHTLFMGLTLKMHR